MNDICELCMTGAAYVGDILLIRSQRRSADILASNRTKHPVRTVEVFEAFADEVRDFASNKKQS